MDAAEPSERGSWEPRLEPGDQFGPYRVERLLGRGGMGEVYEAEHVEHGRRVALKVLHQRLRRPDDRRRFLAEGQLAAAVNHPNSVYIFETDEIAGIPVIAMELVSGGTLKDRVRTGSLLPPALAVDAILQVVEGLEAAHAAGILHRDVKPSNCFIDRDGTIKIGDFGLSISTISREALPLARRSSFEGTPEFAAPEQILGGPLDARADIYSVGATLYFLLTGQPPFQHSDLDTLLAKIRTEPAPLSSDLRSRIPADLAALIRRCLAKQPSARPGTYADLKKELAPFASAAATPAPVGLRAAATAFDLIIMVPVVAIILGHFVGSQLIRNQAGALILIVAVIILYWGILEGAFGAAYGKRRCGLRVVTSDGRPPGVARALTRSAVFVLPFTLPAVVDRLVGSAPGHSSLAAALPGVVLGVAVAGLVIPARRRNGFTGLHDILTDTHVIKRADRPEPTPAKPASRTADEPTGERVGPYDIISLIGATEIGRMLLGWDPRLRRSVWIHVLSADGPPVSVAIRNASRVGRLHWLHGRRDESSAWDAYESLDGQPLLALTSAQTWHSVSMWLCDLARELVARSAEGSLGLLAVDRVWITSAGRGKLLDFRAPGLLVGESPAKSFDTASAQQFLHAVAHRALGSPVPPLPLSVTTLLGALERRAFGSLAEAATALDELKARPDRLTPSIRGMALALGVVVYQFTSDALGRLLANEVLPALPFARFGQVPLTVQTAGLVGCAALGLLWAFALRGGFWLRGFGIAVVTTDGAEVSRLRAVSRAAIVWCWVPAQLLATGYGGPLLGIVVLRLGGLLYAAVHPERGLQDRIAGTYLVPR
ncbi:MAG TPA: protein kinase [Vicinamibacterales bacterium]|nr:protein kinase [Vicinamibacterales bacterium]